MRGHENSTRISVGRKQLTTIKIPLRSKKATSKDTKLTCSRISFWRNQMTTEFLSGQKSGLRIELQKIPTFISMYNTDVF